MKMTKLLLPACVLLSAVVTSQAKEWRGIVPAHSTRADVVRLLGNPNAEYGRYDLGDELAVIFYARHPCSEGAELNVPPDTVTSITVYPQKTLRLADLQLDLSKFKKLGDSYAGGRTVYQDEEEGIRYAVFEDDGSANGKVMEIYYQPAKKDAHLRCPVPANNTPEVGQTGDDQGPGGDPCPEISIIGPAGDRCPGRRCSFSAKLSGLDSRFSPTFKWEASAGTIVSGQGTSAIEVDTSNVGDKAITVKLTVGGVIPKGCRAAESYTMGPAK